MLLDFEVRTCSRRCSETGKELQPGDIYFSTLTLQGTGRETETVRLDFSAEAWQGPDDASLGWWRSRVPSKDEKPKLAPTDVMLNLFEALADKPDEAQFRYLLGLLLIRKRILRRDDSCMNESGQQTLTLFASRRNLQYEMIVDEPDQHQAEEIQQRMIDLLYGDTDLPAQTTKPQEDAA